MIYSDDHEGQNEAAEEMIKIDNIDIRSMSNENVGTLKQRIIGDLARIMDGYSSLPRATYFSTIYLLIEDWRDLMTQ